MNYFYLISNRAKDPDGRAAGQIREYLESRGCVCRVRRGDETDSRDISGRAYQYTNPEWVPADTECVIVLGGDGTLLQAARDLSELSLPFIGVNMGTLGYLAELELKTMAEGLDALIEDKMVVQERMMLSGTLVRNGTVIQENIALNEIVVGRGGALNVIRFSVNVNGRFLNSYAADGVILATPTGSTAYNLSAGGPILEPDSSMILMTPVSPHSMINRSIVFADTARIEISLTRTGAAGALVAFDGSGSVTDLQEGDCLRIQKSDKKTKILSLSSESFLKILQNKMSGE